MTNSGTAPLDISTDVGKLRTIIGDVNYVLIEEGKGDYAGYSDDQLQGYLSMAGANLAYAAGYAYLGLAAQFAADAMKVTTDDEAVDLTGRAESMRKLAVEWFNRGDNQQIITDNNYFSIIYPEFENNCYWPAELEAPDIEWWDRW